MVIASQANHEAHRPNCMEDRAASVGAGAHCALYLPPGSSSAGKGGSTKARGGSTPESPCKYTHIWLILCSDGYVQYLQGPWFALRLGYSAILTCTGEDEEEQDLGNAFFPPRPTGLCRVPINQRAPLVRGIN